MARWVTYDEAGELLGMTTAQLYRLSSAGRLPVRRPSGRGPGQFALVDISGLSPRETPPPRWLRAVDVAKDWDVNLSTMSQWCAKGSVDALKIGGRWWISPDAARAGTPRKERLADQRGVSIPKAAADVGIFPVVLRRAVAAGELPAVGSDRVELADVEAWMESRPPRR